MDTSDDSVEEKQGDRDDRQNTDFILLSYF